MAAEEDKKFDAVLDGFVNEGFRAGAERPHCPSPEILAAYHERSLSSGELGSWKEHVIGCERCREILVQLEVTDAIPLNAPPEEETAGVAQMPREAVPRAAGVRVARPPGRPRWRLLVPAGVLAAGLLVWIALHENQPLRFPSPAENKLALKQAPGAPALASSASSQAPPSPQSHDTFSRPPSAAGEVATANAPAKSAKSEHEQYDLAQVPRSNSSADKESRVRKDSLRDSPKDLLGSANPANLDAKAAAGGLPQKVELQARAQAPVVQPQNQSSSISSAAPAPLSPAGSAGKMKTAPPAPAPPSAVAPRAELSKAASAESVAAVSNSRLIAAPGSHFLWRLGPAGLIEFSANGGASWSRQTSGVLVDLLAGSAPSEKVCWIVGRAGTVLLTTDGGTHWNVLAAPVKDDLGGVQATDALHATLSTVSNKTRFETTDGGMTWRRVPAE